MGFPSERRPFGAVVATYGVERYVGDFLKSVSAQTVPLSDIQYVFVDDGSPDASGEIISRWINDHSPHSILVRQANSGPAAARNSGLQLVDAEWVHFPDPDDMLDPAYYERVRSWTTGRTRDAIDLVSTRQLILNDRTGAISDTHALRGKFRGGSQLVNLERHPEYIHLQSGSAFYRLNRIRDNGISFPVDVKPNFEDAYFTALYLAESTEPLVAVEAAAHYLYRRRDDGSSLIQSSWRNPEKYVHLPRVGYLRLAEELSQRNDGRLPTWAQTLLLYDLLFYFREDARTYGQTGWLSSHLSEEFHELAEQILGYIDVETIEGFSIVKTRGDLKRALIMGYKKAYPVSPVSLSFIDGGRRLLEVKYQYVGAAPLEVFRVRGKVVEPSHAKIRSVDFLGKPLLWERIVWLPATGTVRLSLDGRPTPLHIGPPQEPTYTARPVVYWRELAGRRPPTEAPSSSRGEQVSKARRKTVRRRVRTQGKRLVARTRSLQRSLQRVTSSVARGERRDHRLKKKATSTRMRSLYGTAWTFMDRDVQAGDNAEHLYRWVQMNHPEINAWFVLDRDSSDWDRLEADGFRLVARGTDDHVLLILNTSRMISSHVDWYVVQPLEHARFGRPTWRLVWLQHGVTKDDLSRWINPKPISLMVTATGQEFEAIVGDRTPYVYSTREVKLTGFPRHDRLLELGSNSQRSRILVCPTWRRFLVTEGTTDEDNRAAFRDSKYARHWQGLISDGDLLTAAHNHGLVVTFLPHPNMRDFLGEFSVPTGVEVRSYADSDVQVLLAETAVLVTDYSSLGFEAAYIDRPVVYFQFDAEEFFAGTHPYRRGTWSYEADGFGEVTLDRTSAVEAIARALEDGQAPPFAERRRDAFPFRDGQCSARVFEEILTLAGPAKR